MSPVEGWPRSKGYAALVSLIRVMLNTLILVMLQRVRKEILSIHSRHSTAAAPNWALPNSLPRANVESSWCSEARHI